MIIRPFNKTHRTALVFEADNADHEARERFQRLLQSVNGPNIKVDVFTLSQGVLRPGSPFDNEQIEDEPDSASTLEAFASEYKYDQLLVAKGV